MFPSPCGEKVGINQQNKNKQIRVGLTRLFPSPCGEKVGINVEKLNSHSSPVMVRVSVPLRGKGRDQRLGKPSEAIEYVVSVPLRGKGRDQL